MWIARDGTQNAVHKCVYHTGIPENSTARAGISCTKEMGPIGNSSNSRWAFFQSLSMSSRSEDPMDIDMVKSWEKQNIIRLTNWRRNAKREISKESMTDSYEIKYSVLEWLNIIEMKKFVDDGMLLRMKITFTIWQQKNTSTFRANGGFIQIRKVLILCHWGIDLISSRHCLPCNDCNKKQEKRTTCVHLLWQAQTMGGTKLIFYMVELARFMVDSLSFLKSRRRCTKYWVNGATCCLLYLASFFGKYFHEFNVFWYRWIVYSWRRSTVTDGRV